MAKAKTALRKKLAAVRAVTASTHGIRIGPLRTWNDLPCSTWTLMSSRASQIHMAGRTWTRVRRQLVKSSFTPWNSMRKAPTISPSGASQRRRRLRSRTACSTALSSPVRMTRTRWATAVPTRSRRVAPVAGAAKVEASSGASRPWWSTVTGRPLAFPPSSRSGRWCDSFIVDRSRGALQSRRSFGRARAPLSARVTGPTGRCQVVPLGVASSEERPPSCAGREASHDDRGGACEAAEGGRTNRVAGDGMVIEMRRRRPPSGHETVTGIMTFDSVVQRGVVGLLRCRTTPGRGPAGRPQ